MSALQTTVPCPSGTNSVPAEQLLPTTDKRYWQAPPQTTETKMSGSGYPISYSNGDVDTEQDCLDTTG